MKWYKEHLYCFFSICLNKMWYNLKNIDAYEMIKGLNVRGKNIHICLKRRVRAVTREQQRKLRELNKALPKMLKEKIKHYHLKKKDYMLWFQKDDLFLDCFIRIGASVDHRCICSTSEKIKPLWIDDLLWDFLNMPGNKKEPLSLRAIGAFTVSGVDVYKESGELKNWEISELEAYVDQYLEHFYQTIQSVTLDAFYQGISDSSYHEELRVSLSLIHEKKYKEVLDYLSDKDQGIFCNRDVWIHDAIKEFCRKQVNE